MLDLVHEKDVRDAMDEVDSDKSGNVDFYEFLKVGEMIMKKQGELFSTFILSSVGSHFHLALDRQFLELDR